MTDPVLQSIAAATGLPFGDPLPQTSADGIDLAVRRAHEAFAGWLDSAHTFKGDAKWGWVANLLDNKIAVARQVAVDWGLNYLTPDASVSNGMAIAKAVTPTDTSAAIALVGLPDSFTTA